MVAAGKPMVDPWHLFQAAPLGFRNEPIDESKGDDTESSVEKKRKRMIEV